MAVAAAAAVQYASATSLTAAVADEAHGDAQAGQIPLVVLPSFLWPRSRHPATAGYSTIVASPEDHMEELVEDGRTPSEADLEARVERRLDEALSQRATGWDATDPGPPLGLPLQASLQISRLPGSMRVSRMREACEVCITLAVVVLVATTLLAYVLIAMCFVAMNCLGWILTLALQRCDQHSAMRTWLLALQMVFLVQGMFASLVQRCLHARPELAAAFYSTRAKVFVASYDVLSSLLKAAWCVHVQSLVAHSRAQKGCGDMLPCFMYWFSWSLLLHIFFIVPFTHMGVALMIRPRWLRAVRGRLGGAKPGTLEAMEVVDFDPAIFAAPEDPGDSRPQRECCCCLEEYTAEEAIVKTPCQHYLHRECLGKWLKMSNVCPICRRNLEKREPEPSGADAPRTDGAANTLDGRQAEA